MPRKFMLDAVIPPVLSLGTPWASPNPCSQWALLHPTQGLRFSSLCTRCQSGTKPRGILWFVLSFQCCAFLEDEPLPLAQRGFLLHKYFMSPRVAEEPRGPDPAQGGSSHIFLVNPRKNSQADSGKASLRLSVALSCELFTRQRAAAIQELGHIWKILFPCWKPQWVPEQPGTPRATLRMQAPTMQMIQENSAQTEGRMGCGQNNKRCCLELDANFPQQHWSPRRGRF